MGGDRKLGADSFFVIEKIKFYSARFRGRNANQKLEKAWVPGCF